MSGWDAPIAEPAAADDGWMHQSNNDDTNNNDSDAMQVDTNNDDNADGGDDQGGGYGGGGGEGYGDGDGSFACRRCGQEGHKAAECSEPDTRPCHNCGQPGHQSRECPEPRKPREGETCKRCGSTEHIRADCPLKDTPMEGQSCYDCGSTEHFPRDCPRRIGDRETADPEVLEQLWNKVVETDKGEEFDDLKAALLEYVKNCPDMTWPAMEEKLRGEGLRTHIVAEGPRILPPDKELANNQREGNMKYEIVFVRSARVLKQKLTPKGEGEEAAALNMEHLADAGLIRARLMENGKYLVPEWAMKGMTQEQRYRAENKCLRCGDDQHRTRECTQEKGEEEGGKKGTLKCFKCEKPGHHFRHCPEPDPELACKRCGGHGHNAKGCHLPDTRDNSCRRCGKEGHRAAECEEPDTREPMVCRRCNQPGHKAIDCDAPDTRVCFNCQQPGHNKNDCTAPRAPRPMKCFKCDQLGHRADKCPNGDAEEAVGGMVAESNEDAANEVSGW